MAKYMTEADSDYKVSWKLLNEAGKKIGGATEVPCFFEIAQRQIPKDVATIMVYHSKGLVPYNDESIHRWIHDLNEIGFPCSMKENSLFNYKFLVRTADYEYKLHLVSTLMLIRALYEYGINPVPDRYFNLMDKDPGADKLIMLQRAHKSVGYGGNTNHMVTFKNNGADLEKDMLFARFAASGVRVFDNSGIQISSAWNGGNGGFVPWPGCGDCHELGRQGARHYA